MTTHDDLVAKELELDHLTSKFLRERGWQATCGLPGSMWLWTRTIASGAILVMDAKSAVYAEHSAEGREPW